MKLIFTWLAFFACCPAVLLGQNLERSKFLTEAELGWLKDHPIIRVSNEPDWPPFDFVENGKPSGYCIDYFRLLESRLGVKFEFVTDTWTNLLGKVKAKKLDIIHMLMVTEERKQFLKFTNPFLNVTSGLAVRSDDDRINTLNDVAGKRLAVIPDYLFHEYLSKKYPPSEQIHVGSPVEALEVVSSGRADVYYDNLAVINYWRDKQFLTNLKLLAVEDIEDNDIANYSMAVRKDWPMLKDILQKVMETIGENEILNLRRKWFALTLEHKTQANYSLVWKIFGTALTIIFFILFWNYRLMVMADKLRKAKDAAEDANVELERISNIDGLTSLFNRRYFDAILESEWKRHSHTKSSLSLIMCDIDYFKQFNDTYGHQARDNCLKMVTKAIQKEVKLQSYIAARYGGEEFVIILPDTEPGCALTVSKNIKDAIEQLNIPHLTSPVKPIVSLSFGIATMIPIQYHDSAKIIFIADKALYQSKNEGRDRITFNEY